jgi:hypothetical protein
VRYFPELIRILDRFREPRIETLDNDFHQRKEAKDYRLYHGIKTGTFEADPLAIHTLYGKAPVTTQYSSLKNRLKKRLLNSLFHLNMRRAGFSEWAQAFYVVHKRTFIVHVLLALGARRAGAKMAIRTMEIALEYELIEPAMIMARYLRTDASVRGRMTEYDRYDEEYKRLLKTYEAENLSSEYFERALTIFNRQSGGRWKFTDQFEAYVKEIGDLVKQFDSYNLKVNYYRILLVSHAAAGRHSARIKTAEEALRFVESKPHLLQRARIGEFHAQRLQSYLGVRDYKHAEQAAKDTAQYWDKGTNNWFAYGQHRFLLLMNTLRFHEAYEFFREITTHPRFSAQTDLTTEHWNIFEFFLNYALKREPGYDELEIKKRFDLESFVRRVPEARHDKHGMNVAILIAQILHYVDVGNRGAIIDKMEALGTYRSRYLVASRTQASSIFFKMLRIMENNSFYYDIVEKKARRYHHTLKTEVFEIVDMEQELQVVPYEWLWDRVLERLKAQKEEAQKKLARGNLV